MNQDIKCHQGCDPGVTLFTDNNAQGDCQVCHVGRRLAVVFRWRKL